MKLKKNVYTYANRLDPSQLLSSSAVGLRSNLFATQSIIPHQKQVEFQGFNSRRHMKSIFRKLPSILRANSMQTWKNSLKQNVFLQQWIQHTSIWAGIQKKPDRRLQNFSAERFLTSSYKWLLPQFNSKTCEYGGQCPFVILWFMSVSLYVHVLYA